MNNWPDVYVRMYVKKGKLKALAIITNNDILQTKYIAFMWDSITLSSSSVDDTLHIVIKNATTNMGILYEDASMHEATTIVINDGSDSKSYGTWTSTIKPDNVTVELDCEMKDNSTNVIVANCGPDLWSNSVFNRIPIQIDSNAIFGCNYYINKALFGKDFFAKAGSAPGEWKQYNVNGHASNLILGDQVTIINLPESFVSYWVNMGANVYMGPDYAMLVLPNV